jgi:hypothetical protein
MLAKQDIIKAIQQTAKENGGKPLGMGRFEKQTGIKPYDWGKYWVRFGDAQKEAGFTSNTLQTAYSEEFLLNKIVELARKLGKFPAYREIDFEKRNNDPEFPNSTTFNRFGTKEQFARKVLEHLQKIGGFDDVIELCESVIGDSDKTDDSDDFDVNQCFGAVYLFKHGKYYKIGKTNDTVRRGNELKIQLPENLDLIHEIKTDDPSGVEAYWHRRFAEKRMNGEWFDLNTADIKAFKRWRKIA